MQPEFLYRYIPIHALERILQTKKIRFSRLDKVDDPLDGKSSDLDESETIFFVSCWTESTEEDIRFWRDYTPNMAGVRIKLPVNMLEEHEYPDIKQIYNGHLILPMKSKEADEMFLTKIVYTDDSVKLSPSVNAEEVPGVYKISYLGEIGKYKEPSKWKYQNEWRYLVCITPTNNRSGELWPEYFDFNLKSSAIDNIKVVLGPKCTEGDKLILNP